MNKIKNTLKSMRTLHQAVVLGMAIVLAGCETYQASAIMRIHEGMTQQDVTNLLGSPDFRRFNNGVEEWEYRQYGTFQKARTILVSFADFKVTGMDSFATPVSQTPAPAAVIPVMPATPSAFRHATLMNGIEHNDFIREYRFAIDRDSRIRMLDGMLQKHNLTSEQCAEIVDKTPTIDQLKIAKKLYPYIRGERNSEQIIKVLFSSFDQDEMRNFIKEQDGRQLW
ncbi:MAG: DUF4476 domain-containing protein [Mediterranea sp.]|jgi:hypothetical protein|nr:DUF4476 domain-containing protein [Mediterranea sp.]